MRGWRVPRVSYFGDAGASDHRIASCVGSERIRISRNSADPQEALRQTEKLAATGRLAASIAHEINNPLEAVTNLVYLAQKQPVNVRKYLKLADQELDRIAQITKNTLGFYRDSGSPSEVNISKMLEEVQALYARKLKFKNITLRADYGDDIKIVGFPGEIRQIFANLIANAIEAISDNGCLIYSSVERRSGRRWACKESASRFWTTGRAFRPRAERKFSNLFIRQRKTLAPVWGFG